jgi:glucose-6-phosphate 1-dehydrogenase
MWFAMAPPPSLTRDDIQKEKVKLLKAIKTLTVDDCFVGQFTAGIPLNEGDPIEPGYLDDKTVPEGSKCPTYAALAYKINNDTWSGVPFIMRAGKGLDERMAEVRVTFKAKGFNKLVPGQANQFVMRIQPDEAIYLKCMNKQPGWDQKAAVPVLLDMSYASSFSGGYVADAYERMFLNTAKGDGSLFVGSDELVEAWRIFTPLLKQIDGGALEPVLYPFGVRVPEGMDEWSAKYGVTMSQNWQERLMKLGTDGEIEEFFIANAVMNGSEPSMNTDKLKDLVKKAMDGFEPTQKQMDGILRVVDLNGDGSISLDELKAAVSHFATMYHYSESEDHSTFTKGDDQHV